MVSCVGVIFFCLVGDVVMVDVGFCLFVLSVCGLALGFRLLI